MKAFKINFWWNEKGWREFLKKTAEEKPVPVSASAALRALADAYVNTKLSLTELIKKGDKHG